MKPSICIVGFLAAMGTVLAFIAPNPVTVLCAIFNYFMLDVTIALEYA